MDGDSCDDNDQKDHWAGQAGIPSSLSPRSTTSILHWGGGVHPAVQIRGGEAQPVTQSESTATKRQHPLINATNITKLSERNSISARGRLQRTEIYKTAWKPKERAGRASLVYY